MDLDLTMPTSTPSIAAPDFWQLTTVNDSLCAFAATSAKLISADNYKQQPLPMINSELDSSILSEFMDHSDFDNPNSTVPRSDNMRHLSFEEYYNEVVTALDLDTLK